MSQWVHNEKQESLFKNKKNFLIVRVIEPDYPKRSQSHNPWKYSKFEYTQP